MLIFEVIEALENATLQPDISLFSPQQAPKVRTLVQTMMIEVSDIGTYRSLTVKQGEKLAQRVMQLVETGGVVYEPIAGIILNKLACIVPGSLAHLHEKCLSYPFSEKYGSIFREADVHTRDTILALIEGRRMAAPMYDWPLLYAALAWIGDEVVQAHFRHWQEDRLLPTLPALHGQKSVEHYLLGAGWEFSREKKKRLLYHPLSFALVPDESIITPQSTRPVCVFTQREDRCGGCGRHLFNLFDLDLTDPALSFLQLPGERLQIALCLTCVTMGEPVFTEVNLQGWSQWCGEYDEEPVEPLDGIDDWEDFPKLALDAMALGFQRRTAYETYSAYRQEGLSQLGGFPEWVQGADYPHCPQCETTMSFLGQVVPMDLNHAVEGIFYAFFCIQCGRAATTFQTT